MNLETPYIGFTLKNPFVVGASPMVDDLSMVRKLEDAGASAIVMHSLFEEQLEHNNAGFEHHLTRHEDTFFEATSFWPEVEFSLGPERYLNQLKKIKDTVEIPVIASLNGTHLGAWIEYAQNLEEAGADALELNLYALSHNSEESSLELEEQAIEIVTQIRKVIDIPIAVKLSPFISALPHFATRLYDAGASGLVLFNRYYQPDIDIETLETVPHLELSDSSELLLRLRHVALLHGRCEMNLAITGGVHTRDDAIKSIMVGADIVQMVSALFVRGPWYIEEMIQGLAEWMEEHEYNSLDQLKGCMSHQHTPNPEAYERINYMKILQTWKV